MMTLKHFLKTLYAPMQLIAGSPLSVTEIECSVSRFSKWLNHEATLADLTDENISVFMSYNIQLGRSISTANKHRRCLLSLWRFAHRRRDAEGRRLVADLPEVQRIREPKRLVRTWTQEQFGRLLRAAMDLPGTIGELSHTLVAKRLRTTIDQLKPGDYGGWPTTKCDIPAAAWWTALLLTIYYSGLRRGAALKISTEHLQFEGEEAWLFVPYANQKHRSDSNFKLPADCVVALKTVIGNRSGTVFVWPFTCVTLTRHFRELLRHAGLPFDRKCLFHNIRRLSATEVAARLGRAAACDHMGHSAMNVTESYLDLTRLPTIRAADVLPTPVLPESLLPKRGDAGEQSPPAES